MKSAEQLLRVLIVEDSENDALLLQIELERAGYGLACSRVDTSEAMEQALATQSWDVIIADYVMPRFNGLEALEVVKKKGLDVPFIIVSGHITDDTAVAAMKAGAHDYVMKDNLARLGPAVERELREAAVRRDRRQAAERLKVEQVFRQAIENSVPAGIAVVDLDGRQTYVNPAFCAMVGWQQHELVGARPPFAYWPPDQIERITEALAKVIEGETSPAGLELRFRRITGEHVEVLVQVTPLKDAFGNITGWVSSVSDITERKRAESRLAAEHAITRILAAATSIEKALPGIFRALLETLKVEVGLFWEPDSDGKRLHCRTTQARLLVPAFRRFVSGSRKFSFAPGGWLPGGVWQTRRPIWLSELDPGVTVQRRKLAEQAGFLSAAAFPVESGRDFFGVLEFFARRQLGPDPTLTNMMMAIGSEIGQFVQRRRAEEGLRRAHDELELRVQQRTAQLKSANVRLEAAITQRKRLETELLEITEKERRRIGLDLHDDLGQKLSGIALMTKGLQLKLEKRRMQEAKEASRIHGLVQAAMNHASDLAHELATLDVAKKDLRSALGDLAAHAEELFGISCELVAEKALPALEPPVVAQLYKIAQEAVTNAIKHGKAKRVAIRLANGSDKLCLTIQNNGLPFPALRSESTGMGLRIMNYRASLIGGSLDIKAKGRGTLVSCCVPVEKKK